MKLTTNMLTMATWRKSHRALLLTLFVIAFVIIIDWYYANATQPLSRARSESIQQTVPSVPASVRNDTSTSNSNVQSTIESNDNSPIKTRVSLNGQQVPVPQTGTTHRVIQDNNGTTTVDISIDNNSSGSTSNNSSTNVQLNSTSEIDSSVESGTQ